LYAQTTETLLRLARDDRAPTDEEWDLLSFVFRGGRFEVEREVDRAKGLVKTLMLAGTLAARQHAAKAAEEAETLLRKQQEEFNRRKAELEAEYDLPGLEAAQGRAREKVKSQQQALAGFVDLLPLHERSRLDRLIHRVDLECQATAEYRRLKTQAEELEKGAATDYQRRKAAWDEEHHSLIPLPLDLAYDAQVARVRELEQQMNCMRQEAKQAAVENFGESLLA
jgi:hypothetical protein